jgi:hypothetical protein
VLQKFIIHHSSFIITTRIISVQKTRHVGKMFALQNISKKEDFFLFFDTFGGLLSKQLSERHFAGKIMF